MWKPRYYDIGFNLADRMFQGQYNGSQKHQSDLDAVIDRAQLFGVDRMLITASTLAESKQYIEWCRTHPTGFASTVGVHPCSVAAEFYELEHQLKPDSEQILDELRLLAISGTESGAVCAFGEIGLDYDRLHYSTRTQQREMFQQQLNVYVLLPQPRPPLFLHMRNACDDFVAVMKPLIEQGLIQRGNGVVHSFTGTDSELAKLLNLGFYIGLNGCSLRTRENVDVAKNVPLNRLMIETDAPWCEVRPSHAGAEFITPYPNTFYPQINDLQFVPDIPPSTKKSPALIKIDTNLPFPVIKDSGYEKHCVAVAALKSSVTHEIETRIGPCSMPLVKSRNEPVTIGQIAQIICGLHGLTQEEHIQDFVDKIYQNTVDLFHAQDWCRGGS